MSQEESTGQPMESSGPAEPARPQIEVAFTPATLAARLSTLRREVRLPDDALVVRGGTLQLSDLERAAMVAEHRLQRPGISVYAADVADPAALVGLVDGVLVHRRLSFTSVGRLCSKGFEIEQTFDPPHHTVWLPELDEYWLREFRNAFDPPVERSELSTYRVTTH